MAITRRQFVQTSATAALMTAAGHSCQIGRARALSGSDAAPTSPFLQGNFAPVADEVTIDRLEVVGRLPADLNGMFVRNGPNPQFPPKGNYHWFDGDGMLHGVRIADGRASYRNRYVRTAGWQEERAAGEALYTGLAAPLDVGRLTQGKAPFKNAANTALAWYDGRLLALWEGGEPHAIRVPDLETVGPYTFEGALRHPFTAHPKIDAQTGEMVFFGYSPLLPRVDYSVADAEGHLLRTETIRLRRPVMMHDFAITSRYSILMDLPAVFQPAPRDATGPGGGMTLRFDREMGSRFGILPRHGRSDAIRWFEAEPCFVFHALGAYEEGDEVVLIACRMDDYPDAVQVGAQAEGGAGNPLEVGPPSRLYRWRFDMAKGGVREEPLDDTSCDFPRFDERRTGQPMRYGYCMSLSMRALLKYDLQAGTCQRHDLGAGRYGGEGVFIPKPGGKAEDDGWLCTYVFDESTRHSELLLVDCQDFAAEPVARVRIPASPFGFHGLWLDGELLERG